MLAAVYRPAGKDFTVLLRAYRPFHKHPARVHQRIIRRQYIFHRRAALFCGVSAHTRSGHRLLIHLAQLFGRLKDAGEIPCDPFQHTAVRKVTRVRLPTDHDLALAAELKPRARAHVDFGVNVGTPLSLIVTVPASGVPSIFRPNPIFSRLLASPLPSSVMLRTA